ncbi:hypothetical protein QQF64_009337 [Cirrhinus molitorella]|uniref:MTTase N-terminal domain-containing protein n=1 Tax=Cirrhinus molitorella TaxID=172907 RepID=A0ABR3M2F1_9TELE
MGFVLLLLPYRVEVKGETFQHGALRAKQRKHKLLKSRTTRYFHAICHEFLAFPSTIIFSVFPIMPSACDSLVDDIEDMVTSHDPTPHERQFAKRNIVPRPRKHKLQPAGEELQTDSVIPGTQKVWVRTWGCSHNSSDGEYMAGQLAASGYKITENPSDADLWLLNSCTVKNPAEDHFRNSIK